VAGINPVADGGGRLLASTPGKLNGKGVSSPWQVWRGTLRRQDGFDTQFLDAFGTLRDIRQRSPAMH
jgi:hypothetical protein